MSAVEAVASDIRMSHGFGAGTVVIPTQSQQAEMQRAFEAQIERVFRESGRTE